MRARIQYVAAAALLAVPAFTQAPAPPETVPPAAARAEAPPREPRGKATIAVAGKNVTIDYGRPTLKGRPMSALLSKLPADRMWRAGENQVTTFTTETPLV